MKYGHMKPEPRKSNLSIPLARLNSNSSETVAPTTSRLTEETKRDQISPEVVWALALFALNIS